MLTGPIGKILAREIEIFTDDPHWRNDIELLNNDHPIFPTSIKNPQIVKYQEVRKTIMLLVLC